METELVGRTRESDRLRRLLEQARGGRGATVLVSGDAGVGKTRLTAVLEEAPGVLVLHGTEVQGRTAPYGPLVEALRDYLRAHPAGLADVGPLCGHLALLLPELGEPAGAADRPTLFEALRAAFAAIARSHHAAIVLDDLHWSDEAT